MICTGCCAGAIISWEIYTSKKVLEFANAHANAAVSCLEVGHGGRRLISGASNGDIFVWNVLSGIVLQKLYKKEPKEVTGVCSLPQCIYAIGWDGRLVRFADDEDVDIARAPVEMEQQTTFDPVEYHHDDVLYGTKHVWGGWYQTCMHGVGGRTSSRSVRWPKSRFGPFSPFSSCYPEWRPNTCCDGESSQCQFVQHPCNSFWMQLAHHNVVFRTMAQCGSALLATGSFDGQVIIWNLKIGKAAKRFDSSSFRTRWRMAMRRQTSSFSTTETGGKDNEHFPNVSIMAKRYISQSLLLLVVLWGGIRFTAVCCRDRDLSPVPSLHKLHSTACGACSYSTPLSLHRYVMCPRDPVDLGVLCACSCRILISPATAMWLCGLHVLDVNKHHIHVSGRWKNFSG